MKKFILPFVSLFAIAIVLISWKSAYKAPAGALVINEGGCAVYDEDLNLAWSDTYHAVYTTNGKSIAKCHVSNVSNSTGKAIRYDFESTGGLCETGFGITDIGTKL